GYKSLQWPVAADGSDQPLLYTRGFNFPDGKARLFPLAYSRPTDPPDDEFDLHLNNGRLLEHFHEGNLTYRSEGIREIAFVKMFEQAPIVQVKIEFVVRRICGPGISQREQPGL